MIINNIVRKYQKYIVRLMGLLLLMLAWLVLKVLKRDLIDQGIWLVCEKRSEARDNGMHFFCYCRRYHPEINIYYVIRRKSSDIKNIAHMGNIIYADSFVHCLYYLAAEKDISSQAYGAFPFDLSLKEIKSVRRLCNRKRKTVFLQHGIIKDELSHFAFDYDKCNIDFFVTSAQREFDFIKSRYSYPDKAIGCVGLCRFDKLFRSSSYTEKMVLIMPTWRISLKRIKDGVKLSDSEIEAFLCSDYYRAYEELLTNSVFLSLLRIKGYKAVFYLHYQLQDFSGLFNRFGNDVITIADRYNFDVQNLLIRCSMLITDYSSVFFDVAYMNKPIVYYQFDRKIFRESQYSKGYFDYDVDGFGPCYMSCNKLVEYVSSVICNNMTQPNEYTKRADDFYCYRDNHNCERTFDRIVSL